MIKDKNILVYGSNSDLSFELLKFLVPENDLFLVSQNQELLEENRNKLKKLSSKKIINYCSDLNDLANCNKTLEVALKEFGYLDYIFFFQGYMTQENFIDEEIIKTVNVNALSAVLIINSMLKKIDKMKKLKVVVITSVAGDRGKKSTLFYGASKSLISSYIEGLIQKYSNSNINFYDLKPGPIKTKMTKNFQQSILYSSPESVSRKIYKVIQKKNSTISYIPFWWKYIMMIIKFLPNFIYHKVKL